MLPLRDNVPTRSFPIVTVALIVANVLVWVLYQLPDLQGSVTELAYQPCEVVNTCPTVGQDWEVTAITAMFMHGSWAHLLGNMLFLWIFGNNVEDALGRVRFLLFYIVGGLAATAVQTFVTLAYASDADAAIPNLGCERRDLGRARRLSPAAAAREGADDHHLRPPRGARGALPRDLVRLPAARRQRRDRAPGGGRRRRVLRPYRRLRLRLPHCQARANSASRSHPPH